MPRLLYRYVLADLIRTIALTTGVLVTVIAFGATIKPLAQGLLAPGDVAKYVAMAMVPMLQFALPFAAGFGATIVFHRLTADNEILAAAASGISYRRILLPVVAMGFVLTLIMLGMVHFVIPRFWQLMQQTVARDVTRMFQSAIEGGQAFEIEDVQIYAENLQMVPPPRDSGIRDRLVLRNVAAARIDPQDGSVDVDVTAPTAVVDFYEHAGRTYLALALTDAVVFDSEKNSLMRFDRVAPEDAIPVLGDFRDEPKTMSLERLLAVRAYPDSHVKIRRDMSDLADELRRHATWRALERRIEETGRLVLRKGDDDSAGVYIVHAERLRQNVLTRTGAGRIVVEEFVDDTLRRRIECDQATLATPGSATFGEFMNLVLSDCEVAYPARSDDAVARAEVLISGLHAQGLQPETFENLNSGAMLERAEAIERDRRVDRAADELRYELLNLHYEINARIWQRNAQATTILLLLVLGAVLAMAMRNSLPLAIYLVSFLPAIIDILLISGGEQMYRDEDAVGGLIVMWSGNVALLGIILVAYVRLARN